MVKEKNRQSISRRSSLLNKKILRIINHHLYQNSLSVKINLRLVKNLIFDGSFLEGRKLSVVILINAQNKKPIAYSFRVRETVKDEVVAFLLRLKGFGLKTLKASLLMGLKRSLWLLKRYGQRLLFNAASFTFRNKD